MRRMADSEGTDLRVITERGEEELVVQQKRQIVMPAQLVRSIIAWQSLGTYVISRPSFCWSSFGALEGIISQLPRAGLV
jgi:hypothetical protein